MLSLFIFTLTSFAPSIEVSPMGGDVITSIHIHSVLARHQIRINKSLYNPTYVYADTSTVLELLDVEAPRDQFDIYVEGDGTTVGRSWKQEPHQKSWIRMLPEERSGAKPAPFSAQAVIRTKKLFAPNVRDVLYIPRTYLGPDMMYHVGFDINVMFPDGPRHCQLFEKDGKQFVTDEDYGVDFTPRVRLLSVK